MKKKNIFKDIFPLEGREIKHRVSESESWLYNLLPADADVTQTEEEKNNHSFKFVNMAILAVFALLFGRIYFLQIVHGSEQYQRAEGNRVRSRVVRAPRGIIYDSKGTALVKNVPNFEVTIVPADLPT